MRLPLDVYQCIEALEGASFPTYAVGGCVRDDLLGLAPHDFDLCTAALPDEIQAVFHDRQLVLAGVKHGTGNIPTAATRDGSNLCLPSRRIWLGVISPSTLWPGHPPGDSPIPSAGGMI